MKLAEKILSEVGVAVTPAEDFGCNDFFRISLTSGRVIEGITRLKSCLIGL